ncbi:MAG: hypothetical protein II578_00080, partial [Bacteroidaceae bacterium]|nr:hypothetical protein [Bacteroidaceae bacterium]
MQAYIGRKTARGRICQQDWLLAIADHDTTLGARNTYCKRTGQRVLVVLYGVLDKHLQGGRRQTSLHLCNLWSN